LFLSSKKNVIYLRFNLQNYEGYLKINNFYLSYFLSKLHLANIIFSEELKVKINFIFAYAFF